MADQIFNFPCLIPSGTLPAAPIVIPMIVPEGVVEQIEARVPPGPSGTMGFRLTSDGTAIIPVQSDHWFVVDDEVLTLPLANQHDSGRWALTGYNIGIYNHTVYVRFHINLAGVGAPVPAQVVTLIDPAALSA